MRAWNCIFKGETNNYDIRRQEIDFRNNLTYMREYCYLEIFWNTSMRLKNVLSSSGEAPLGAQRFFYLDTILSGDESRDEECAHPVCTRVCRFYAVMTLAAKWPESDAPPPQYHGPSQVLRSVEQTGFLSIWWLSFHWACTYALSRVGAPRTLPGIPPGGLSPRCARMVLPKMGWLALVGSIDLNTTEEFYLKWEKIGS